MKKIYTLILLFFCFLLMSCNTVGSKDAVVARIGSETLYAEDLDFLTAQNNGDTASMRYKNARDNLLYSLAKVSLAVSESPAYDSAWKSYETMLDNRILSVVYSRFHLMDRLGYSDEKLQDYFKNHRAEFDSNATYLSARKEVAGRYYIAENQDSLNRFIQKVLPEKDEAASVNLLSFEGDSATAATIVAKFNAGLAEDSIPMVQRTQVVQNRARGVFRDSSIVKALFLADSMAIGEGRLFKVQRERDTSFVFVALKMLERKATVKAKIDDHRESIEQAFVMYHRESMVSVMNSLLASDSSVKAVKLAPPDPEKYYRENSDKFRTVPGCELYHVAMKDSVVLAKTMANVKDLESFKAVAATISEKEETSDSMGYVGRVKKHYALPYGIGMMPSLWTELEGKGEGYISTVIRSSADSLYHSFYVAKLVPSELKPFDRVKNALAEMYADNVESIDPATVLVEKNGEPLYTKADLMKVFAAEPDIPYNKETHRNVVNALIQSYLVAEKAKQEKVEHSWEYRAFLRVARMEFIAACYDRNHKSNSLVELPLSENQKKFEYFYNENSSYKGKSFEEAVPQVTSALESRVKIYEKELVNMQIWNMTNVFFYDQSKSNIAPITTAEETVALGDSAAKSQNFDAAISAYQKVMTLFANRDTLFRTAVYNLAQVYSDAQRYEEAAGCYNVFLKVWPDAPETEKAMFSLGFILSENLNRNGQALEVLEDFQKRFPKSELKESVDWLVENIKSDGKLAEDLMKKIEAEE